MPPRIAPARGRGHPQGGGRGRATGAGRGGPQVGHPSTADKIKSIGVRRPGYGTAGRHITVHTNAFVTSIPDSNIYHYDIDITPTLPGRARVELLKELQSVVAADIFTSPVPFDHVGKNMYATYELALGKSDTSEFNIGFGGSNPNRPPKVYKVRLTKVATINSEVLNRYVAGTQAQEPAVLTALMAMNVAIHMEPSQRFPHNRRSFYTEQGKRSIGGGIELWRGYFQSVRPTFDRILVNLDISTGVMYKSGPLIGLCLEFLNKGQDGPLSLSPTNGLPDRERIRLRRFLSGLRVSTSYTGRTKKHTIYGLSATGANSSHFQLSTGGQITVSQYFQSHLNRTLQYPSIICVELRSGALIPLEFCDVPPGQLMKKEIPSEKTSDIVAFSTMKPKERFESIKRGAEMLSYGQSNYVRQFGMNIDTSKFHELPARVINPPTLKYGPGSKQLTIAPKNGMWNMVDKKFFRPAVINHWVIVIYEQERRFNADAAQEMASSLVKACQKFGIVVNDTKPAIEWAPRHSKVSVGEQLRAIGRKSAEAKKTSPNLLIVVLPPNSGDVYMAVKHFGDVKMGVATQCLLSNKCFRAKEQYWANVLLKVNVKLGGINTIPDPTSIGPLTDPRFPTIVFGADVMHPPPGAQNRPSYTSLVGSVDSNCAKFIAKTYIQTSGQELIDDLKDMCKSILEMHKSYREKVEKAADGYPKRLIFYRDGVSEGQFEQVLQNELPRIQAACAELKISPKITLIVVGKRHHFRFDTENEREKDTRSGNLPAGTVMDKGIGHPTDFDYFLLSHGGLLGTSRPSHYSILHDDNEFSADAMQSLSFALCHVYARSTRSVSIPAPVYYADIVCSRARNHFDPLSALNHSETMSQTDNKSELEAFRKGFLPLNKNQAGNMYFM
ncbi:argonaute-like protein [Crucibulum laeve]|uniref:Argonaute-like protein n=1 Tax=Crucibulum laeve TaxID=68775 RepID=A0A5C3LS38_9AGAR|nr:argonaute-like protein [Crucibulum laeve]